MPRPKVPLSQRQRAVGACNFCRSSKKRCSATVPCTACVRRGRADSCYLPQSNRGARHTAAAHSPGTNIHAGNPPLAREEPGTVQAAFTPGTQHADGSPSRPDDHQIIPGSVSRDNIHADGDASPNKASSPAQSERALQYEPRSRMLRNLHGERGVLTRF
jgi:hypothetical protein